MNTIYNTGFFKEQYNLSVFIIHSFDFNNFIILIGKGSLSLTLAYIIWLSFDNPIPLSFFDFVFIVKQRPEGTQDNSVTSRCYSLPLNFFFFTKVNHLSKYLHRYIHGLSS